MFSQDYYTMLLALMVCGIFATFASAKVNTTYNKFGRIANRAGITGYEAAQRLLSANGINAIRLGRVSGKLSDHYDPGKGLVNLSDATHDSPSIGAVAVAAHEIGHVMQRQDGYLFYRIRTAIVPLVNIGSHLAGPLVILGVLIDGFSLIANADIGFYLAMAGVILYGGSLLFCLVTLPVELNASRRAARMLTEQGILSPEELPGAKKVLFAAALTYVASLLTSLVYFLRFLLRVLTLFGRRSRR